MSIRIPRRLTESQFITLLAATTIGVYAVIAAGAALATTGAASCSSWPLCTPTTDALASTTVLVEVGHRLLTGTVGLMLVATVLGARTLSLDRRARLALFGAAVVFPVQVGVGGLVVLTEVPYVTEIHLVFAATVFVFLLTALSWTLEGDHVDDDDRIDLAAVETDRSTADASDGPATGRRDGGLTATARAYLDLTKPRLMWLLCLLALAGMALATTTGTWPSGVTVAATLAGGIFAIGASGTFNHLFERDRDRRMDRTADRPVATDQIPLRNAAAFGVALLSLSMLVLVAFVNLLAAALTFGAFIYYSVIYTVVLKPNTSWNIAIGGGAGALPALIGWTAVTGAIGLGGVLLAGLVVIWTPAHFYNLAIVYRDDYARAGYPMFPVVAGVSAARRRIMLTLGGTLLVTASLVALTPLGWLFAGASILAGTLFLGSVVRQCRLRTPEATLQSFHASNAFLGIALLAIVIETTLLLT